MRQRPPVAAFSVLLLLTLLALLAVAGPADAVPLRADTAGPPTSMTDGGRAGLTIVPGATPDEGQVRVAVVGAPSPDAGLRVAVVPATAADEGRVSAALRPVPGAVVRPFDPPEGPYGPGHRGVDLVAAQGDAVVAALAGTVAFSGQVAHVGWVTIDHGGGLATTYGPLEARIPQGATVSAGRVIGRIGHPDAPPTHLDWGARLDGAYIDPLLLLRRWQLRLTAVRR